MEAPQPKPNLPICPHCGMDPAGIATAGLQIGGALNAMAIFCANPACRKMYGVQIVGVEKSPIVRP